MERYEKGTYISFLEEGIRQQKLLLDMDILSEPTKEELEKNVRSLDRLLKSAIAEEQLRKSDYNLNKDVWNKTFKKDKNQKQTKNNNAVS